jgi:MFS family permease
MNENEFVEPQKQSENTTQSSEVVAFRDIAMLFVALAKKLVGGDAEGALSDVFGDAGERKKLLPMFSWSVAFLEASFLGAFMLLFTSFTLSSIITGISTALANSPLGMLFPLRGVSAHFLSARTSFGVFFIGFLFGLAMFFLRTMAMQNILKRISVDLSFDKLLRIQAVASIFSLAIYVVLVALLVPSLLLVSLKIPIFGLVIAVILILLICAFAINLTISYIFINKVSVQKKNHFTPFLLAIPILTVIAFFILWILGTMLL